MFSTLLVIHSYNRWLVLIVIIWSILNARKGLKQKIEFTQKDELLRKLTISIVHVQMVLGVWLYFSSSLVETFFNSPSQSIGDREIRFFSIEHALIMLISIIIITIGTAKAKRKKSALEKHKTIYKWFLIAFILIIVNIPWGVLFFVERPLIRI